MTYYPYKPMSIKWKIVNSKGKTIETFRNIVVAQDWLARLKKEYYDSSLKIKRIDE